MNKNKEIDLIVHEVLEILRKKNEEIESLVKEIKFLREWTDKMIDYFKDE